MTIHTVNTIWQEKSRFDSHIDEHVVTIDATPPFGDGAAPGPKKLLLTALTGCTAMDVASMLPKMRVSFDRLEISASAEMTDEHPKVYTSVVMEYHIWGASDKKEKVERAVQKSVDTYCGVHAMLQKSFPIEHRIIFH